MFSSIYSLVGVENLPYRAKKLVKRYLILITIAHSLFMLSNTFFILFVIDYIGYTEAGLLLGVYFFIHAVFDYPTGVLGDWIGQKWILFIAYSGYAISFGLLGLLVFIDSPLILVIAYILFALSSSQESGAFATWFDNNYKVAVQEEDPDRQIYRTFLGKSQMIFDFSGGTMLIVGGWIATFYQRELVFIIQTVGLSVLAPLLLILAKDFPEIEKVPQSIAKYFHLFFDGLINVIFNPVLLLLVMGSILYISAISIFFNLMLFPIYFGYTGTDLGASIFRFTLFFTGAIGIWKISDWIKNVQVKKWLPVTHFIHAFLFFGGMAILMIIFPITNSLNLVAAFFVGCLILITHLMRMTLNIFVQRIYLDVIDDEKRNSFYSLLPTAILLVTSPLTAVSGNIGENQGFATLFIFLGILALIASFFYLLAMRFVHMPKDKIKLVTDEGGAEIPLIDDK
ncbi:MAG: MFS transporter [Candidatus Hermodarchaeota archaeon]